jgi:GxxExxY protein
VIRLRGFQSILRERREKPILNERAKTKAKPLSVFGFSCKSIFFSQRSLRLRGGWFLGSWGDMVINELTKEVIGAAIEVHRALGAGLLESAYGECLCHELGLRGLCFERQKPLPIVFKEVKLDCGYRLDLLVSNSVVVEVKAVETLLPVHEQQIITCLKVGGWQQNFNASRDVSVLKDGIKRIVLGLKE